MQEGNNSYEHDLDGCMKNSGDTLYHYDSLNRLTCIEKPSEHIEFTYDSFDRRLTKKIYSNEQLQTSLRFLYDGQNEIGAVDDQNKLIEFRMLGQGLGAEIGAAVALELQDEVYIPIHDHRGNVALLLGEQGNPFETYRYTAFGNERPLESINPWRFSSKRMEGTLVYFGKRFYDPNLGRWLSPDPQGFEDGPNLYTYVRNRLI